MSTSVIDNSTLRTLLANQRQDVKKGILNLEESLFILGISQKDFYKRKQDPQSHIIPSKKQGKYIFSSIIKEFKRIHGVSYREATPVLKTM